jgi:DNA-binding transcriptional regulator YdaS (Cro superfamily)
MTDRENGHTWPYKRKGPRLDALLRAIDEIGSQEKLAKKIGKAQPDVSKWLRRDKRGVPAEMCVAIELATRGKVTRYELRPDVFGDPPTAANGKRRKGRAGA